MKRNILIGLLGVAMLLNTGCASYLLKQNWNDAQAKKAVRVEADGERVMVGLDLGALSYLKDNWPAALGAGVVDAGLGYGLYLGAKQISQGGSGGDSTTSSGRDTTSINISGDGNTVNTKGDTTSTKTGP